MAIPNVGTHQKGSKVAGPVPVTIIPQEKGGVTRLGTPTVFLMLLGLFFVYYALHGFDGKYNTFNGSFAGKGHVPSGTKPRYGSAVPAPIVPSVSSVPTPSVAVPTTLASSNSTAIATLQRYIANLTAVKNPTAFQRAELTLYRQRLATYQAKAQLV